MNRINSPPNLLESGSKNVIIANTGLTLTFGNPGIPRGSTPLTPVATLPS